MIQADHLLQAIVEVRPQQLVDRLRVSSNRVTGRRVQVQVVAARVRDYVEPAHDLQEVLHCHCLLILLQVQHVATELRALRLHRSLQEVEEVEVSLLCVTHEFSVACLFQEKSTQLLELIQIDEPVVLEVFVDRCCLQYYFMCHLKRHFVFEVEVVIQINFQYCYEIVERELTDQNRLLHLEGSRDKGRFVLKILLGSFEIDISVYRHLVKHLLDMGGRGGVEGWVRDEFEDVK